MLKKNKNLSNGTVKLFMAFESMRSITNKLEGKQELALFPEFLDTVLYYS